MDFGALRHDVRFRGYSGHSSAARVESLRQARHSLELAGGGHQLENGRCGPFRNSSA
jgi:hypothetical protein